LSFNWPRHRAEKNRQEQRRAARDVLLGLHKGNEQKLGDWGFEVDTSARPASKTTPPSP